MSTYRYKSSIYLVGTEYSQILGSKLPSNKQVLSVFFFNHNIINLSIRESAKLVIKEVSVFWEKARIPIREMQHCIAKLEKMHQEWITICKNKNRLTDAQKNKEEQFRDKLSDIFDIAHANALSVMKNEEDKIFLINQRKKGRPGCFGVVDLKDMNQEKRRSQLLEAERKRKKTLDSMEVTDTQAEAIYNSSTSGDDVETTSGSETEEQTTALCSNTIKNRGTTHILNERVVSALDKCKISDRSAMHIITAVAESLGHKASDLIINRTSLQRQRQENRFKKSQEIKENFKIDRGTLHWDGKLLPEITGRDKVERLPVIITHNNGEQLIGVPKLSAATGSEMADVMYELLCDWNVEENIVACCFDTTASNTGVIKGAATLLEKKLERNLLYFPCRHHIYELLLRGVFECYFPVTTNKDVQLFRRFQDKWKDINTTNFKTFLENDMLKSILSDVKDDITDFCKQELKKDIVRDDYRELLELTTICLGTSENVKFRIPGPTHHARWMSKALYSLKMYLFRSEFKLTEYEEKALADICAFIIKFYVMLWFNCVIPYKAPYQDLSFIKEIYEYRTTNKKIADMAIKKMFNHLWYLSDECVAMALFDNNVSIEMKKKIAEKIKNIDSCDEDMESVKRVLAKPSEINQFIEKELYDFVTVNTINFFFRFGISFQFVNEDPLYWNNNEAYKTGINIVSKIKVVNDTAERGVKLIEEYNNILTKNETEKQYLLQVVTDYRKQFQSHTKSSLTTIY